MFAKRIAVAVSGGVDSLFALLMLHEQSRVENSELIAVHGLFLPHASPVLDANASIAHVAALCDSLSIPFHMCDLRAQFDSLVVAPFITTYAQGRTPNPCALCNARIKFGLLWDAAQALGADILATGHYAHLTPNSAQKNTARVFLSMAQDVHKDQSYFLALVPQERLASAMFPLADWRKKDIIHEMERRKLAFSIPKESQEVCFVPHDAYRPFLEEQANRRGVELGKAGVMYVHENGEEQAIGTHKGLWQYTEGQRKGLGVAWSSPLYVAARDVARNALIVAPKVSLQGCIAQDVNTFLPFEEWPTELSVRVRHRQHAMPAHVTYINDTLHIDFHEAQQSTAPGQLAVVYDAGGRVLAGGIISQCFA